MSATEPPATGQPAQTPEATPAPAGTPADAAKSGGGVGVMGDFVAAVQEALRPLWEVIGTLADRVHALEATPVWPQATTTSTATAPATTAPAGTGTTVETLHAVETIDEVETVEPDRMGGGGGEPTDAQVDVEPSTAPQPSDVSVPPPA